MLQSFFNIKILMGKNDDKQGCLIKFLYIEKLSLVLLNFHWRHVNKLPLTISCMSSTSSSCCQMEKKKNIFTQSRSKLSITKSKQNFFLTIYSTTTTKTCSSVRETFLHVQKFPRRKVKIYYSLLLLLQRTRVYLYRRKDTT